MGDQGERRGGVSSSAELSAWDCLGPNGGKCLGVGRRGGLDLPLQWEPNGNIGGGMMDSLVADGRLIFKSCGGIALIFSSIDSS